MRVAITTSILRIPPTYFVVDHAQRMRAQHEFRVFALAADVTDPGVTVPITDFVRGPFSFRGKTLLAPLHLPLVGPAIRRFQPDLVHQHFATWCTPAVSATKALHVPLVTTLHGYDVFLANSTARTLFDRWQQHNINLAQEASSRYLAVSEFLAGVAVRSGFDSGRMHVHYQGVDTAYFTPLPAGSRRDEVPLVLFVGSLSQNKGPRDLIEASRRLIGTIEHNLVLIGVGPLAAELAAETAGDRHIRLLGRRDRADIREWMRRAAVHVLPAQEHNGRREAAGLVLLEAQACGTPVVAYDSGGTGEMMLPDVSRNAPRPRTRHGLARRRRPDRPEPSSADHARFALAARLRAIAAQPVERSCAELAQHYESVLARARCRPRHRADGPGARRRRTMSTGVDVAVPANSGPLPGASERQMRRVRASRAKRPAVGAHHRARGQVDVGVTRPPTVAKGRGDPAGGEPEVLRARKHRGAPTAQGTDERR